MVKTPSNSPKGENLLRQKVFSQLLEILPIGGVRGGPSMVNGQFSIIWTHNHHKIDSQNLDFVKRF